MFCFLRIWYVGVFIDSIIADFFFGAGKYYVYLILLIISTSALKKDQSFYREFISRKRVVEQSILLTILLMIISLVYYYCWISGKDYSTQQFVYNYFKTDWYAVENSLYLWNMDPIQLTHPGFFWFFFLLITKKIPIAFLWILLIVSTICLLVYIACKTNLKLESYINELSKKIKKYFWLQKNEFEENDLQNDAAIKQSTKEIIKNISNTDIIPFSLSAENNENYQNYAIDNFSNIEEDNNDINKEYANNIINTMGEFFEKYHINSMFLEYQLGPSSLRVLFSFPDKNQSKWASSDATYKKLLAALKIKSFSVFIKNDRLFFDLPLSKRNKISFKKTVLKLNKSQNDLTGIVGVNGDFEPIELKLFESPITLVSGDSCSGKQNLLMQLILSMLARYSPNKLMLTIIDNKNSIISKLEKVKHTIGGAINNIKAGVELMEKIIFEMKYRVKIINDFKCHSINEYNKNSAKDIPSLLIIINDINDFIAYDAQYTLHFLKLIKKYAKKLNIFSLITANIITELLVSPNIKKIYTSVIALQTRTREESELLIKKSILSKLFGEGDCYYIKDIENPKVQRAQSTYINNDLINQIISKINNYPTS